MQREHCTGNKLLDQLADDELARLTDALEPVSFRNKQVIYEPDQPMTSVYFPTSGMTSLLILMRDGRVAESGVVGNEGMLGLPLLIGSRVSPYRMHQQIAGDALRVSSDNFAAVLKEFRSLRFLIERYMLAMLHQAAQNAACHLLHSLEQRLCRWLLATRDRACADEFALTQEFLAETLGVQRQSVNQAAGALQRAELIAYRRGHVRILSRPGLEQASCECYAATNEEYERIIALPEC
jgi:CRP-like cAMP-binding protein